MHEQLFAKVGNKLIWESTEEKLLGITIDKNLNFDSHLSKLCKKVGGRLQHSHGFLSFFHLTKEELY